MNSERNEMILNTGRPARRSIPASTSSSVVGSAQCASSNTTSTRSHLCQTFHAPDQHVEGLLLQTLRAEIELGIAVAKRDREHGRKQTAYPLAQDHGTPRSPPACGADPPACPHERTRSHAPIGK